MLRGRRWGGRAKAVPVAPMARKEKKGVEPVAAAVEKGREEGVKGRGGEMESEKEQAGGFAVGEVAVAGEKGALGRLRSHSQPPLCSSARMCDEAAVVLLVVGGELSRRYAAYIDEHLAHQ